MQYTLRNIPEKLDHALRSRARQEGKSLNQIVLEALRRALGLEVEPVQQRRLDDVAGTWEADASVEETLTNQRRIDPGEWR